MYVREYILRLSRNVLGLACCSAAVIYGGGPPTTGLVWIGILELNMWYVGWIMDYGDIYENVSFLSP